MTLRRLTIATAYALSWLGAVLGAIHLWNARTDYPPIAWCPNYETAIVHPTPWEAAHGRLTRTKPARCADSIAVTFGYLR